MIPNGAALARDAFRSPPAVRSRVRAATAPYVCFRPSCRPADLDLRPAPAGRSRLTADSTVLYQAEGRSKGEPGVAARVPENGLYVAHDVSARLRLARSAIERKHESSLVITTLLV